MIDLVKAFSGFLVKNYEVPKKFYMTYEDMTDEKGIARRKVVNRGSGVAWFKDPSGNVFSVLCN